MYTIYGEVEGYVRGPRFKRLDEHRKERKKIINSGSKNCAGGEIKGREWQIGPNKENKYV